MLLNQSLLAASVPNNELFALRQAKLNENLFLERMKVQIMLLKDRLARELHQRHKIMEAFN